MPISVRSQALERVLEILESGFEPRDSIFQFLGGFYIGAEAAGKACVSSRANILAMAVVGSDSRLCRKPRGFCNERLPIRISLFCSTFLSHVMLVLFSFRA
jgi:hypothetical protein